MLQDNLCTTLYCFGFFALVTGFALSRWQEPIRVQVETPQKDEQRWSRLNPLLPLGLSPSLSTCLSSSYSIRPWNRLMSSRATRAA
jgi:hypothetical protein